MSRERLVLGIVGAAIGLYGAVHLLLGVPIGSLIALVGWMIAAVVLHDAVVAPLTVAVAAALTRLPNRARRYVQGAFVAGALVTAVALPLIALRNTQPQAKAILQRNYAAGLALLLGLIAAVALVRYAIRVARDSRRPRTDVTRAGPSD